MGTKLVFSDSCHFRAPPPENQSLKMGFLPLFSGVSVATNFCDRHIKSLDLILEHYLLNGSNFALPDYESIR